MAVNSCLKDCYNDFVFKGDKQTTCHRHIGDTPVTYDGQAIDLQVATPIEYNKEERENISSTARIGVREGIFGKENQSWQEKKPSKESYFQKASKDFLWMKAIKKRFALESEMKVMEFLQTFELEMTCLGRSGHKDMEDYKSHFCSWLNKHDMPQSPTAYGSKFTPRSTEGGIIYSGGF